MEVEKGVEKGTEIISQDVLVNYLRPLFQAPNQDDWHQIIIDWDAGNAAWLEAAIAHEMGHGVGLDHNGTVSPWLMMDGYLSGAVDRQVTALEADAYD